MLRPAGPADHVAFVNTERDCEILAKYFADSAYVRVCLHGSGKVLRALPTGPKVWVDSGVDGLEKWPAPSDKYTNYMRTFACVDKIADVEFHKKPTPAVVSQFVNSVLDACAAVHPAWISVPQLPVIGGTARNRINRELAEASGRWAARTRFPGQLILPLVFTNQSQINLKTARTPKMTLLAQCYRSSGATGVWVVDSSLTDQDGSRTLEQTRFPGLINLHKELVATLPPSTTVVGGPYWGLNLVLWARGLIRHPAIGLGNQYQYHLQGGVLVAGKSRIALSALKRWVIVNPALQTWLADAISALQDSDPAQEEFSSLLNTFSSRLRGSNRAQIAGAYKRWFDSIADRAPAARALTLYQQLSSAYVLGKGLPELPKDESTARRPERVAQQLMMVCL